MAAVMCRSFAAALFLMGKGYTPLSIEKARDGSGGIIYRWPSEAEAALDEFYRAKTRLNDLTIAAREGVR